MTIEEKFEKARPTLEWMQTIVKGEMSTSPQIVDVVHSVKSRIKSLDHLMAKIARKQDDGLIVTSDTLFSQITDLVGVRVLILFPQDFKKVHGFIKYMTSSHKWKLVEAPLAYTWDDDLRKFFKDVGINTTDTTESKKTLYTSVHYVVKIDNNEEDTPCCEIQVRTLLEEVFGEIDHQINYPIHCGDEIVSNQLKTLSKLVSAGVKHAETIYMQKKKLNL